MEYSRVRVKMCGMTNSADINHAIQLGIDAIGIILYSKSKRYLPITQARQLLSSIPAFMNVVAVMVNPTVNEVEDVIKTLPIHCIQFHGDESAQFCEQFNFPFIKSIPAQTTEAILEAMKNYNNASAILLDTPSKEYGGSGRIFDWSIIPDKREMPIILAGGLNPANITEAISQVKPYAVDVCSGIEEKIGIKSNEKMIKFLNGVNG